MQLRLCPMASELTAVMDRYLDALLAHDPSLLPLADTVRVTENGYPIRLGHGLFETAREVTYRHDLEDPANGQIALFGAVRESIQQANFWLRLKIEAGDRLAEPGARCGARAADGGGAPVRLKRKSGSARTERSRWGGTKRTKTTSSSSPRRAPWLRRSPRPRRCAGTARSG